MSIVGLRLICHRVLPYLLLLSVLHHGNGKAIGIIIVHSEGERDQAGVAGDAPVKLDNASHSLVFRFAKRFPTAYTVVGIDKNKIEGRLALQLGEQIKRFANSYLCTVTDACPGERVSYHVGMLWIHFQAD